MFMFHYQPNQNTGCKVKYVVNMKRQLKRLTNCRHRRRSEQPFYLPRVYHTDDAGLTFGELPRVYPGVRGFKNAVFS